MTGVPPPPGSGPNWQSPSEPPPAAWQPASPTEGTLAPPVASWAPEPPAAGTPAPPPYAGPYQPPAPLPGSPAPLPGAPAPPPYTGPYSPPAPTNGMAIASLVLALLGLVLCGIGLPLSVLGVVLGAVALRRIAARGERGRSLAITGVSVGGVGAALSLLAIGFLVWVGGQPVDTGSRDLVRTTLSNAALAQQKYRDANDTYAPSLAELRTEDYRPTDGVAVTVRWANSDGFCMEGVYGSAQMYVTQDRPPTSGICAFADNPA